MDSPGRRFDSFFLVLKEAGGVALLEIPPAVERVAFGLIGNHEQLSEVTLRSQFEQLACTRVQIFLFQGAARAGNFTGGDMDSLDNGRRRVKQVVQLFANAR